MPDARSPCAPRQLLLIEDDAKVRRSLHLLLQSEGYEVRSFAGVRALLAEAGARAAPYLVTDYRLSDGDKELNVDLTLQQAGGVDVLEDPGELCQWAVRDEPKEQEKSRAGAAPGGAQ